MPALSIPGAVLAMVGAVQLLGAGSCPSVAAVARQLEAILPAEEPGPGGLPGGAEGDPLVVEIVERQGGGALRLRRLDDGREREVAAAGCEERALGAALVIAGWRAAAQGGLPPPLDLPPPGTTPTPGAASPPPEAVASVAPIAEAVAPGSAGSPLGAVQRAVVPSRRRYQVEVAAALVGSLAGSTVAPGALVEVSLGARRRCVGGRLGLTAAGLRGLPLGAGQVAWTRIAAALGPRCQLGWGAFTLGFHGDAQLALVVEQGEGFSRSGGALDYDVGLGGGVRAGLRVGRPVLFLELGLVGWLRAQRVEAGGEPEPTAQAELPRLEGSLSLGVALPDL